MTRVLPDRRGGERDATRRGASSTGSTAAPLGGAGPRRELTELLDRYADAFARADLAAVAACHVTPVLFVTEWDSTVFSSAREVAEGFRRVVDDHRARRFVTLTHRIETVSAASRIVEVGVRWTFHDGQGRPLRHDRYRYVLRRVDDRGLLINAVVVLGGSPVAAP
ncbi:nuclear transport factor 2 family protein [Actinomycetospora rhizophila]|uniref:Nuclear transport factor 2 family protein n=1 Tax=Actinomycetospora rhizophila TaxID=1416876 RepID=A0ABV9Z7Q4_9PSEU